MPLGLASNEGLGRTLGRSLKLQPDNSNDDQPNASKANKIGWLLEEEHAGDSRTGGTDPGPDRIGGAHRNGLECEAHEPNAEDGSYDR